MESAKRRTRRYVNNSGNVPGPCPIAPRDEISRSGEPLTPIKYVRAGPKSCVGLCETCVLPEIYALGTYFMLYVYVLVCLLCPVYTGVIILRVGVVSQLS